MFAFTVSITLVINGVAQNGATVPVAGFARSVDLVAFLRAWENWRGIVLYVKTPHGDQMWLNGVSVGED